MIREINPKIWSIGIAVVLLSGWEIAGRIGVISALFFPLPSAILQNLVLKLISGEMARTSVITLLRMSSGLGIAALTGIGIGLIIGRSEKLRGILNPFISAFHPMPKIAIFPLIMVMLGIGELSKVAVIAFAGFFPLVINTMTGVKEIEPVYLDVATIFRLDKSQLIRRIIIPGSLPFILSGLRIALNSCFLVAIAVELLSAREGLGAVIWNSWETFRIIDLYASLFMIVLLGVGFNYGLTLLSRRLIRWSPENGK